MKSKGQKAKSKKQEKLAGFYGGGERIEKSKVAFCRLFFAFCFSPKAWLDFIVAAGEQRDQKLLFAFCGLLFAFCFSSGIALKEVCESRYFLRLLKKRVGPQNNPDDLIQEAFELRNIFKSRIRKLRGEEE
jgi:hypothetical protein